MGQKHILVVDDVTINLKCAGEVLREMYKVTMAKSGEQALQLLEQMTPDLILLDVKMPELDGYETLRRYQASEYYKPVPVAFMTADTSQDSKEKAAKLGVGDCIYKPLKPEMLLRHVEALLREELL